MTRGLVVISLGAGIIAMVASLFLVQGERINPLLQIALGLALIVAGLITDYKDKS